MKKYAKYPALAVTLAIMAVIFVLSSQPAELSTKVSRAVTETVQAGRIKAITPLWFSTTNLNANVRKWAHIYIYCALGVSMAVTVQLWLHRVTLRQKALLASALCMLYAAGDEFHQYFVPGRAAQLSDVAIDAIGFLPCVAAVSTIRKEMNSTKWTLASIGWQLGAAWLGSFLVYQLGSLVLRVIGC